MNWRAAADPLRSIMLDPVQPHRPRLPTPTRLLHQTLHYAQYANRQGFAHYAHYAATHHDFQLV